MSKTIHQHIYFGELTRDEYGGWTGDIIFPPINSKVQILINGNEDDLSVSPGTISFFEDLILFYPEISKTIQERFYELRGEYEDLNSKDDVWTIFQLESVVLDDVNLLSSEYWELIYGTDYGGHFYQFEMKGKNVIDMVLSG